MSTATPAVGRPALGDAPAARLAVTPGIALRVAVAVALVWLAATAAPSWERFAPLLADGRAVIAAHAPVTWTAGALTVPVLHTAAVGWLGAALAAALAAFGGPAAVGAASGAAVALAFALVDARARRRAPVAAAAAATALALVCVSPALRAGGGAGDVLCAAALLAALDGERPRALVVGLVTLAWCNLSAAGLLAPAAVALAAAGAALDGEAGRAMVLRRALVVSAVATLLTPGFWAYVPHALVALRVERRLVPLVAMHPADVAGDAYRAGFATLVFAAMLAGSRRAGDALLLAAAFVLALANGAFVPLAGVVAAPLLAESLFARVRPRSLAAASVAFLALFLAVAQTTPRARSEGDTAAALVSTAFAEADAPSRIVCVPVDWCGIARFANPRVAALVDDRVHAFPADAVAAQLVVQRAARGYEDVLRRADVRGAVLRTTDPLATLLRLRGWHDRARNARAVVLAAPGAR